MARVEKPAPGPTISEQLPPAPNRNMQFKQDMMTGILDLQRPTPKPVAKPTPTPVAKPTPKPVAKPAPTPVAKPTPKPAPAPAPKAVTPTPKKKSRRFVKSGGMIGGSRGSLQIPTGRTGNVRY